MHLLIPVAQASFLKFLRNKERSTKSELARISKKSYDSVRSLLRNLKTAGLVVEYESNHYRSSYSYGLCAQLADMSNEEFAGLIEKTISAKGMPIKQKKPVANKSQIKAILQDAEAISFIKLNRPYMPTSAIARKIGLSAKIINCIEDHLGLKPISDEDLDPQASQIIGSLGFIPAGSEIHDAKTGGTIIRMPGDNPGINSVTRFYGW